MSTEQFTFHNLGIDIRILELLDKLGFVIPTPIQRKAIPAAVAGKDIIGVAQTGTGKTLAFGIPMLQQLSLHGGKGMVLVPTRELAIQVNETLEKLTPAFGFDTAVLIGGVSVYSQIKDLKKDPTIIIATPGRLNDLLNRHLVRLDTFKMLVLDEADRMLDMGFLPQIEIIIKRIPKERHTMLFSATIPEGIIEIAKNYMRSPVHIEVAPSGTAAEKVTQELFVVKREHKGKLLGELLKQYTGSILIFTRTKRGASKVTKLLKSLEHKAAEIHSDRSQSQRKEALDRFKAGRYRILTATDIASRGIDVTGIELVVNYDIPEDPENYIHRIGRTGRAGKTGHAISFATPEQGADIKNIEKIMRHSIPLATHPNVPAEKFLGSHAAHAASKPQQKVKVWANNKLPHKKELRPVAGSRNISITLPAGAAPSAVPVNNDKPAAKKASKSNYNTKSWKDYKSKPFIEPPSRRSNVHKAEEKPPFVQNAAEHIHPKPHPGTAENRPSFPRKTFEKSHARPHSESRNERPSFPPKTFDKTHASPHTDRRNERPSFPRKPFNNSYPKPQSGNRFESNEGRERPNTDNRNRFLRREDRPFKGKPSFHDGKFRSTEHKPFRGKPSFHDNKFRSTENKPFHTRPAHPGAKREERPYQSGNRFESNEGWKRPAPENKFARRTGGPYKGKNPFNKKPFHSVERRPFYGKRNNTSGVRRDDNKDL